ncbi:MAG TPA: hypothetical protein VL475_14865, partial [Planctomycetaceae bacterium]|nr:hypothetical protein [Planctomycetaceae bacterium]
MKRTAAWFVFVIGLGFPGAHLSADLITNGSFEDVAIGSPYVSTDTADVSGWTFSGTVGEGPLWRVGYSDGSGSITVAGDGEQFVTLGGGFFDFATTNLDQTLTGLTVGQ